jgi:site-specific DNA-adenine methylase
MEATEEKPEKLKAPFPWFGGKSRVAGIVWDRFGDVKNYVEPFFGSGAVLLLRPTPFAGVETVNDADGMVSNFWRAVRSDPDAVAHHADWPVNENDLHARHAWLVGQKETLQGKLEGAPEYFDAKVAGWWCWGVCCWIGSGFCSGKGPWSVVDGQLVHLGNAGQGVNRQLVRLGNAGQGVNRQLVHLGSKWSGGQGVVNPNANLAEWFAALSARLARVRVCCGDWTRVMGPTVTERQGIAGIFLDPPYADTAKRCDTLYSTDSTTVAHAVREWAIEHGGNEKLRIALCGYEGEHDMPDSWECVAWKAHGGYGSQGNGAGRENKHRERIWFSPACLRAESTNDLLTLAAN